MQRFETTDDGIATRKAGSISLQKTRAVAGLL